VSRLWVKICGIRSVGDALAAAEAGADAIGINFVPSSARYLDPGAAEALVQAADRAFEGIETPPEWIGVFADEPAREIAALCLRVGLGRVQLHGHEPPEAIAELEQLGVAAYRAFRIGDAADVKRASECPGDRVLVDAKVEGSLGGTGHAVETDLVVTLAKERKVVLAGGLRPENVGEKVALVRPFGVDTASGVEQSPGVKDRRKMRAFVEAARAAHSAR
jgi:phosphoribosylanthranilate isomerase